MKTREQILKIVCVNIATNSGNVIIRSIEDVREDMVFGDDLIFYEDDMEELCQDCSSNLNLNLPIKSFDVSKTVSELVDEIYNLQ